MKTPTKLVAFALSLVVVGVIGAAIGAAVGPEPATAEDEAPAPLGAGVVAAESGYRMVARSGLAQDGGPFRFAIVDRAGAPVMHFVPLHERPLHLVVVNRELTDFHHVHPALGADGTWTIDLPALAPGSYRAIADFVVDGGPRLALGVDLSVAGAYAPVVAPDPAVTATVDGYAISLESTQGDGGVDTLAFTVRKDGAAVTDLEPYLGAYGHLIALRADDLAYSHVHPLDSHGAAPADGTVRFEATLPSAGRYRLFLDFQHGGTVHTAAFTFDQGLVTGSAPAMEH
jgi:hypothetical protein